jgi:hypothetical protein
MSPDELAKALAQPGRASIRYLDRYNPERPLVLECFRPQAHAPDKPVVIVQHGASRNGAEYSEAWLPAAERHGLLIVAITFSKEAWPDAVTYNNGHVLEDDGTLRPRALLAGDPGSGLCAAAGGGHHPARQDVFVGAFRGRTICPSPVGDAAARHFRGGRSRQSRVVHIADARSCLPRRGWRHRADARRCRSFSRLSARDLFRRPGHRRDDRKLPEARGRDGTGAEPVCAGAVLPRPRARGSRKARRALPLEPRCRAWCRP